MLSVYGKAADYKPMGKPMAWIFTIARNHALARLRVRGRDEELDENLADTDALDRVEAADERAAIAAMLTALDTEERQLVMLHAVGGMRHRETAALLGIPIGTALSKYNRAIKKMRRYADGEEPSK